MKGLAEGFSVNLKIIRFLLTGLLNTVVGYSLFAFLIIMNISYILSLLIATIGGVIFNCFSFGSIVYETKINYLVLLKFSAAYTVIYGVNALLLGALVNKLLLSPLLGQLICITPNVLLSWILLNNWVYKNVKKIN